MWQLLYLLNCIKKIKAENEDYKVILCPPPWAKSLINWLTAKILFTLMAWPIRKKPSQKKIRLGWDWELFSEIKHLVTGLLDWVFLA